jgi:hypothetical protein
MVSSVSGSSLLSYYQGQTALGLLGALSAGGDDASAALLSYYEGKEGLASADSTGAIPPVTPPTAPWNSATGLPDVSEAVQNAIDGQSIVDPSSSKLDAPAGVSATDYKNLFALYQGLNTLYDLANTAAAAGTASADPSLAYIKTSQLQSAFASGLSEVQNFLSNSPFNGFNLTAGAVKTSAESTVGIPNGNYTTFTTGIIATGDEAQPLAAFQGDVKFSISVASTAKPTIVKMPDGTTKTITTPPKDIDIDLTNMGSRPRTIDNVVNYINGQLSAAKVSTRFAAANLGSSGTTVTLPNGTTSTTKGATQWGLTINGSKSEQVSFSAPSTAAAVYVSMGTGGAKTFTTSTDSSADANGQTTTPDGEQLMKLQTGQTVVGDPQATITHAGDSTGLPNGAVFGKALPDGISSVEASATGSDGSVYLLANADGSVNTAPVQGGQGVALLKYDASGKLLYSKIVAGLQSATGAAIAVNTDGSVAVAGTNTTTASTAANGLTTAASTSAFVQVYDATGAPSWNKSVPALAGSSVASGVTFGADGQVYLAGGTNGSVGNQIPQGDSDEFIQGFDKTGAATFTKQFGIRDGTSLSSGIAYDASTDTLYTAGLENSKAVVRSFALTTTTTGTGASKVTKTTAAAGATRTLGVADNVAGIAISSGQVVVGGTVQAATISAGTVTQGYKGVSDGFIASISTSLTASSSDSVAYLGLSGATQVGTGLAVAGGQAYLTGTIAGDPSSLAAANATEGFVSGVDTSTGAVSYSARFAGANGQASPSAITVSATGASVLDRLGLPQGTINAPTSNLIVANTSIQAGQSFYVRTAPGGAQNKITITATDTLDTLTKKLNLALGGGGKASVLNLGANSQLQIEPNDGGYIELDSQPESNTNPGASASKTDVLAALGLSSGVIRTVHQINGLTDVNQLREYGLSLPNNLDLSTTSAAQHAANALQAAMSAVQKAYQDLAHPPTIASEAAANAKSSGGTVPTYLTNEISNLQAGLDRLTANNSASSSATSLLG